MAGRNRWRKIRKSENLPVRPNLKPSPGPGSGVNPVSPGEIGVIPAWTPSPDTRLGTSLSKGRCPLRFFVVFLSILGLIRPAFADESVVWVSSDFTSGGLAVQDAGTCDITEEASSVSGDPVVRSRNGMVYVINRLGYDNITVFQPPDFETPVIQFTTGNGTNPQDIYVVDEEKAYVTVFEQAELLIVHPGTGESLGTIDLSYAADADGIPEMTHIVPFGNMILVLCQRLDRTTEYMDPSGPGCIAIIDPSTDTVFDANPGTAEPDPIILPLANPTDWAETPDGILLACTGFWSDYEDGGIVRFSGLFEDMTVVASEADYAVDFSGITMSDGKIYVIGSDASWINGVQIIDGTNYENLGSLDGVSGGYIPFIMSHSGMLYVADQGTWTNPELAGIVLFDCSDNSLYCGPASTGLPPISAAVVEPLGSDVYPPVSNTPVLAMICPNPATSAISIRAIVHDTPLSRIQIFDLAGRLRADTRVEHPAARIDVGLESLSMPSGQYLVRYFSGTRTGEQILVVRD